MSDSEWGYAADARMTSVELGPIPRAAHQSKKQMRNIVQTKMKTRQHDTKNRFSKMFTNPIVAFDWFDLQS